MPSSRFLCSAAKVFCMAVIWARILAFLLSIIIMIMFNKNNIIIIIIRHQDHQLDHQHNHRLRIITIITASLNHHPLYVIINIIIRYRMRPTLNSSRQSSSHSNHKTSKENISSAGYTYTVYTIQYKTNVVNLDLNPELKNQS